VEGFEAFSSLYEAGAYGRHEGMIQRLSRRLQIIKAYKFCKTIQSQVPGKRLLEVGAGKGAFLEGARRAGFQICGIEPSKRSREFANQLLGEAIVTDEPLESHNSKGHQYDVICAWHVLEHIQDPEIALAKISTILRAGGRLYLGLPNFDSAQAHRGLGNWYHLDPPRHMHHFTVNSIRMFLERQGFSVIEFRYDATLPDITGELLTLLNRVSKSKNALFNFLKRNNKFQSATKTKGTYTIVWNFMIFPIVLPIALGCLGWDRLRRRSATFVVSALKIR
jgi:SAM-dependent methyltransferase